MTARGFAIDWTTQIVMATSSSDASVTIPTDTAKVLGAGQSRSIGGSWWLMGVAGTPAYINSGAAATSANALHPIGRDDLPKRIAPGTAMHALASTGTGQVWFVRCFQVD